MRILLDTHTFLWIIFGNERLSSLAREEIEHPENVVIVSIVILWEIAIKASLGKLDFAIAFEQLITDHLQ